MILSEISPIRMLLHRMEKFCVFLFVFCFYKNLMFASCITVHILYLSVSKSPPYKTFIIVTVGIVMIIIDDILILKLNKLTFRVAQGYYYR